MSLGISRAFGNKIRRSPGIFEYSCCLRGNLASMETLALKLDLDKASGAGPGVHLEAWLGSFSTCTLCTLKPEDFDTKIRP